MQGTTEYDVTITLSAGTGGSISPSGKNKVRAGTSFTFTVTPSSGYQISDVLVNGKSIGAVSSYSMNPWANQTVEARFTQTSGGQTSSGSTKTENFEWLSLGGEEFRSDVTKLVLQRKGITDISVLAKCKNLVELNLNNNSISDLSPLAGLTSLQKLYLNHNNITNISALSGLSNLSVLQLEDNDISDWSPVDFIGRVSGRP